MTGHMFVARDERIEMRDGTRISIIVFYEQ